VLLPYDVAPGAEVTFAFFVKPLSCGFAAAAPFRFRMLSQTYGTFGEETPDPGTTVSTAADFVSQQAPSIAPAGARIPVTVAFRNTTLAPWTPADGYALASAGPAGNTTWGTASVPLSTDVAPGAVATFSFVIDVPATPAKYNFQWQMSRGANAPFGAVSPATAIDVVTPGPANYQGLWWAAPAGSEAGWGIQLAHQDDTIFATWFTYDANGNALWLSMTAQRNVTGQFAGQYTGALVRTTGPAFDIAVFPPNQVRSVTVGSGALAFDDSGGGTFAYTLNGVSRTKSIVRQAFALLPTCTFALFRRSSARLQLSGSLVGVSCGLAIGLGREPRAPARHRLCDVVHVRPRRLAAVAFIHRAEAGGRQLRRDAVPDHGPAGQRAAVSIPRASLRPTSARRVSRSPMARRERSRGRSPASLAARRSRGRYSCRRAPSASRTWSQNPKRAPAPASVAIPRTAKITAATACTKRTGIRFAMRSPSTTAGTFATIMPSVVPATTGRKRMILRGKRDRGDLRLVAHLHEEEGDERRGRKPGVRRP
jgi:hypothetical protein